MAKKFEWRSRNPRPALHISPSDLLLLAVLILFLASVFSNPFKPRFPNSSLALSLSLSLSFPERKKKGKREIKKEREREPGETDRTPHAINYPSWEASPAISWVVVNLCWVVVAVVITQSLCLHQRTRAHASTYTYKESKLPMGEAHEARRIIIKHLVCHLLPALLVLLLSACGAVVGSPDSDALLKFKESLANAEALGNWNPDTSPCTGNWTGVGCSKENILGLHMENMSLAGKIDIDALVPLLQLRTLNFMGNRFEGPLPEIKKLKDLKFLFLSNNQFSGIIPDDAFAEMLNLRKVYLSGNKFSGNIPSSLAGLVGLVELRLDDNEFDGPIPEFKQKDLKLLNLSNNKLEGPIPESVAGLEISPSSFAGNRAANPAPKAGGSTPTKTPATPTTPKPGASKDAPKPGAKDAPKPAEGAAAAAAAAAKGAAKSLKGKPGANKTIMLVVIGVLIGVLLVVALMYFQKQSKGKTEPDEAGAAAPPVKQKSVDGGGGGGGGVGSGSGGGPPPAVAAAAPNTKKAEHGTTPETGGSSKRGDHAKLSFIRDDRERFELQDLLRASAEVLGSGNFGSSYKALLTDGKAMVVKRFKQMNEVGREEFYEHMRRLGRLTHPNLLPLVAYYYRKEEKLLVFDYVKNGSLASHLHDTRSVNRPGLDWPIRLKIIKGVTKGLAYLHTELPSLTVPHGHLKSSNVLLDESFEPCLMDYTLVPMVNLNQAQQIMVAYKSPEYVQHSRATKKTDVWTLGVLILEILTAKFPTNYFTQGSGNHAELMSWVSSIAREGTPQALDKKMGDTRDAEGEIKKLFDIGVACCEEDAEKRLEMKDVAEKIQGLKERDMQDQ